MMCNTCLFGKKLRRTGQRNFIAILQAYVAVQRQVGSRTNLRLTACSVHCNVPCCGKRTICTNQSTIRNLQCGPLRNVDVHSTLLIVETSPLW